MSLDAQAQAKVDRAQAVITQALIDLKPLFIDGTKFTLIARPPIPEAQLIISDDDPSIVEGLVREWRETEAS